MCFAPAAEGPLGFQEVALLLEQMGVGPHLVPELQVQVRGGLVCGPGRQARAVGVAGPGEVHPVAHDGFGQGMVLGAVAPRLHVPEHIGQVHAVVRAHCAGQVRVRPAGELVEPGLGPRAFHGPDHEPRGLGIGRRGQELVNGPGHVAVSGRREHGQGLLGVAAEPGPQEFLVQVQGQDLSLIHI